MRTVRIALLACVAMACLVSPARAQSDPPTIDVGDLLAEPDVWNGERIRLEGELVGDYSRRDSGVWVQLNDDRYAVQPVTAGGVPDGTNTAVGALIPERFFAGVEGGAGRYGRLGPLVRLEGTFRHDDPRFSGETYLEVESVSTIRAAAPYPTDGLDAWSFVGLGLLATAGGLAWSARRRRA